MNYKSLNNLQAFKLINGMTMTNQLNGILLAETFG